MGAPVANAAGKEDSCNDRGRNKRRPRLPRLRSRPDLWPHRTVSRMRIQESTGEERGGKG